MKFQQALPTVALDSLQLDLAAKTVLAGTLGVPLNPDAALAKFALQNNLGIPLTGEIQFQWQGDTYIAQMWSGGAVYCKNGDFGVMHIA